MPIILLSSLQELFFCIYYSQCQEIQKYLHLFFLDLHKKTYLLRLLVNKVPSNPLDLHYYLDKNREHDLFGQKHP